MITVYIGKDTDPKETWEILEQFESVSDAQRFVQSYLKNTVPNLMYVGQRKLDTPYWTHYIEYGPEKGILIEDTSKHKGEN